MTLSTRHDHLIRQCTLVPSAAERRVTPSYRPSRWLPECHNCTCRAMRLAYGSQQATRTDTNWLRQRSRARPSGRRSCRRATARPDPATTSERLNSAPHATRLSAPWTLRAPVGNLRDSSCPEGPVEVMGATCRLDRMAAVVPRATATPSAATTAPVSRACHRRHTAWWAACTACTVESRSLPHHMSKYTWSADGACAYMMEHEVELRRMAGRGDVRTLGAVH